MKHRLASIHHGENGRLSWHGALETRVAKGYVRWTSLTSVQCSSRCRTCNDPYGHSRTARGQPTKPTVADVFNATHPGIHVQVETRTPNGYFDKLLAELMGNAGPDIFWLNPQNAPYFMHSGLLEPLDEYIERAGIRLEDYTPAAWVYTHFKGHIYGVPRGGGFPDYGIAFNRTMFDEAGLPYPEAQWTWDDFKNFGNRLTRDANGDGEPEVWGARLGGIQWWWNWLWSGGGRIFDDGLTTTLIDSPESTEAFQEVADMILQDRFASIGGVAAIGARTAAMGHGNIGPLLRRESVTGGEDWGMAPLPGRDMEGGVSRAGSLVLAINKASNHKEEAWTFLRWLISEEGVRRDLEITGNSPALRSIAFSYDFAIFDGPPYDLRPVMLSKWRPQPFFSKWIDADNIIMEAVNSVWTGAQSAEQAMSAIRDNLNAILAESPDLQ